MRTEHQICFRSLNGFFQPQILLCSHNNMMIQQNIIYCRVKFVNSNFSFTALMICSDFLWSMKPHIHKPRFPVKLPFCWVLDDLIWIILFYFNLHKTTSIATVISWKYCQNEKFSIIIWSFDPPIKFNFMWEGNSNKIYPMLPLLGSKVAWD